MFVTFISEFEKNQNLFSCVPPLVHSGLQNTSNFGQKLPIRTAHHTFLESNKNLYYILSPRRSHISIFQAPAHKLQGLSRFNCFIKWKNNDIFSFFKKKGLNQQHIKFNKIFHRYCWNANKKDLLGRNVHCWELLPLPLHFTQILRHFQERSMRKETRQCHTVSLANTFSNG